MRFQFLKINSGACNTTDEKMKSSPKDSKFK